jgi:hypothetical protein
MAVRPTPRIRPTQPLVHEPIVNKHFATTEEKHKSPTNPSKHSRHVEQLDDLSPIAIVGVSWVSGSRLPACEMHCSAFANLLSAIWLYRPAIQRIVGSHASPRRR